MVIAIMVISGDIMATHNDITGDPLITKSTTDAYRNGYDLIWGKKKDQVVETLEVKEEKPQDNK